MSGFSSITGSESIMFADNASFDGTERGGALATDGQIWIGSTIAPHVRRNTLIAGSGISIINGTGTITIAATGSGITTINGDSGSITGTTVTIYSNNATRNAGSSVKFVNSSTTSTFNVTDASFNTIIGNLAGNLTLTSTNTTAVGYQAGKALTSGANNTIFGGSGILLTTGGSNVLHGHNTGNGITTGSNNTILGTSAGSAYVTGSEASNLLLASNGVNGESNVIRIGRNGTGAGQQNICYIASFGTSDTQSAYQAGTWTPTITGLTTSGTTTYTTQSGNYVRVGNIVTAWCECNISAMTGTGDVILGGFPFAFSNSGTAGIFTVYIGCWTLPTGCTNCNIIGLVSQTNARVQCNGPTNAITAAYLQAANIASNMVWTITYVK